MSAGHAPVPLEAPGPRVRRWPRNPVAVILVALIRAYRIVFAGRPSPCRFEPTCSAYGLEAVLVHGAGRGAWLTARRIVSCRPGGGLGWDPVPPPRSAASSNTSSNDACPLHVEEAGHGRH